MHRPDFPNVNRSERIAGFTLIELLVVISIIVVLVGILLPVAAKVREQAHAADTKARVATIGAMMQAYYGDFKAYPGPLSNMQIYTTMGGLTAPIISSPAPAVDGSADLIETDKVTGTENVVLGLLGGLRNTNGVIYYTTAWVGSGPGSLGVTPKKMPAYGDLSGVVLKTDTDGKITGKYSDENEVAAADTEIPEFVDTFPDPMPFLMLRARVGQRSNAATYTDTNNPIVTNGTDTDRLGTYDLSQVAAYVGDGTASHSIGAGKKISKINYQGPGTATGTHGLRDVNVKTSAKEGGEPAAAPEPARAYAYPYNLYPALRSTTTARSAKQADSYIIISAGIDRVYGTQDDITNFGEY